MRLTVLEYRDRLPIASNFMQFRCKVGGLAVSTVRFTPIAVIIGCGLYDCSVATHFGMVIAIARGTPEHPLFEPEDLLTARIVEVSESAKQMGITIGVTGIEALQQMLKTI